MAKKKKVEKRGRRSEYPWEKWMSPGTYRLVVGQDIQCKVTTFRSNFWRRAKALNLKVHSYSAEEPSGNGKKMNEIVTFIVSPKHGSQEKRTKRSSKNSG